MSDLAAGATGGAIAAIGSAAKDLREAIVGKEMTPELQVQLQVKAMDLELAATNAQMEMIKTEAASSDPWTSRARPSFMYLFYFMVLFVLFTACVGIWFPNNMDQMYTNMWKGLNAIPEEMWWLFGAGYLGYTGARMSEKKAGVSK
jgi:tetrahydromethanopterin S-methyltransferase subunit E